MKKSVFIGLCATGAVLGATVAIATPVALTQKDKEVSDNSPIQLKTDLNGVTEVRNGQNYLELGLDATHKENKDLNYQWFYRESQNKKATAGTDFKHFVSNHTGQTNKLILVDDIENYHNYEFVCAIYDNDGNFTYSKLTKIQVTEYVQMQNSSIQVENINNLQKNIPVWSSYFLDDSNNFKPSKNLRGGGITNRLLTNVCSLLGLKSPETINKEIQEIWINWTDNSRSTFDLNIQLKSGREWSKDIYELVLNDSNVSANREQVLTLHNLKKNDLDIINFNKDRFIDYISKLQTTNLSDSFVESNLKKLIVESNCGINDESLISSVNYQISKNNSNNQTFGITINLAKNCYSIDLEKYISIDNIQESDNNSDIQLEKVNVLNFMNMTHKIGLINYQYLKESKDNPNLIHTFDGNYRTDIFNWICELLKINSNLIDKITIQFKNESKIDFQNIENRQWAIPLRLEIFKKQNVNFVGNLALVSKVQFDDSYTNIDWKINGNTRDNQSILIETQLVAVSPSIEIKNENSFEPYNLTKYTISYIIYVQELLWKSEFETLYMDGFSPEKHYAGCREFNIYNDGEDYGIDCGIDLTGLPANASHYFRGEDNWGYADVQQFIDDFLMPRKIVDKEMIERMDFYVYLPPERIEKGKNYYKYYKGKTVHEFRVWLATDYFVDGLDSIESEHSKISKIDDHSFKLEIFEGNYTYIDFDDYWLEENGWI